MKNKTFRMLLAILVSAFGLLTLFMSTSVILDLFGIREKEGNYVLFVVWSNFICSIFYLISVWGFIKNRKWTTSVLAVSVIILLIAYGGLFMHINSGGIYEAKTVKAMAFRIVITLIFTVSSYFLINKNKINNEN